jgi:hypothetical protein
MIAPEKLAGQPLNSLFLPPPEVIILQRIVAPQLVVHHYLRGQSQLIPATPQQTITGHHPADEKPVLFKALEAVARAGGIHGTILAVDRRDIVAVQLNEKSQGAKALIGVSPECLPGLIPIPCTIQGRGMPHGGKADKGYQEKYAQL